MGTLHLDWRLGFVRTGPARLDGGCVSGGIGAGRVVGAFFAEAVAAQASLPSAAMNIQPHVSSQQVAKHITPNAFLPVFMRNISEGQTRVRTKEDQPGGFQASPSHIAPI